MTCFKIKLNCEFDRKMYFVFPYGIFVIFDFVLQKITNLLYHKMPYASMPKFIIFSKGKYLK